tara:strand:- start:542 stop:757 length:216 start_codon:yes stop_codon:yes gene_type:complete
MVNTENELLIMADTFKEVVEKKNEEIKELKKVLLSVYGVIRVASMNEDEEIVEALRTYLSDYMDTEFSYPE